MSRIGSCFEALREKGRTALIPFITAGDPAPEVTVPLMHAMVAAGADLIELGVPFSDPMADGPVIQRASERALEQHVRLADVLEFVRRFREQDGATPIVLMGYLNPVEAMGYEVFAESAAAVGVDGLLTVDLPPEEAEVPVRVLEAHGIDPIFLLAPTSTAQRIASITDAARGFVYYVSLKGVTGSKALDVDAVAKQLKPIRAATELPLGVGFGIKDPRTAAAVAQIADAVIVGSVLVAKIEALKDQPAAIAQEIAGLIAEMRQAMDQQHAS